MSCRGLGGVVERCAQAGEDSAFGIASPPGLNNAPRLNKRRLGGEKSPINGDAGARLSSPSMRRLTAH